MGARHGRAAEPPPNQHGTGHQRRRPPLPNACSGEAMPADSTRKAVHCHSGKHLKDEHLPLVSIGLQGEIYLKPNEHKRIQLLFLNGQCTGKSTKHTGLFSPAGPRPSFPQPGKGSNQCHLDHGVLLPGSCLGQCRVLPQLGAGQGQGHARRQRNFLPRQKATMATSARLVPQQPATAASGRSAMRGNGFNGCGTRRRTTPAACEGLNGRSARSSSTGRTALPVSL